MRYGLSLSKTNCTSSCVKGFYEEIFYEPVYRDGAYDERREEKCVQVDKGHPKENIDPCCKEF